MGDNENAATPEPGDTSTGTPQESVQQDDVQVEHAEMEDLDAFLENPSVGDEETDEQFPEAQAVPPKESGPSSAPVPEEEQSESAQQEVTREEFNQQRRQLEGLELLVKRRTSELGELRKSLTDLIAAKAPGLKERMEEDPTSATNDLLEIREAQKAIQQVDEEATQLHRTHSNQRAVLNHVDFNDTPLREIAKVFLSDGIAPEAVDNFMRNPWAVPATTTIQAAKRAKAERYLRVLVPEYKKLRDENTRLKAGKGDVLRKVDAAARQLPSVNGNSGGAGRADSEDFSLIPPDEMSDAQLDSLLKKAARSK